jgi:transcriptional accessory protein Tex/SPT6
MTRSGFGRAIASRENSLGCIEILHLFIESQIKQNSQTSIEQLVIKDLLDSFERKDAALFEQKLGELLEKSPMSDDKLRRLFKVLKFLK